MSTDTQIRLTKAQMESLDADQIEMVTSSDYDEISANAENDDYSEQARAKHLFAMLSDETLLGDGSLVEAEEEILVKPTAVELAQIELSRLDEAREIALIAVRLAGIDDGATEILNQYIAENPDSDYVKLLRDTNVDKRIDIMFNASETKIEIGQVVVAKRETSPTVRTNVNASNETASRPQQWFASITRNGVKTELLLRGDQSNDIPAFNAVLTDVYKFDKTMDGMSFKNKAQWLKKNGFEFDRQSS